MNMVQLDVSALDPIDGGVCAPLRGAVGLRYSKLSHLVPNSCFERPRTGIRMVSLCPPTPRSPEFSCRSANTYGAQTVSTAMKTSTNMVRSHICVKLRDVRQDFELDQLFLDLPSGPLYDDSSTSPTLVPPLSWALGSCRKPRLTKLSLGSHDWERFLT